MELSDEQLVLKTWEVAVRKGWVFVVDTLLRGGVELFSPTGGDSKDQGFWGQFGDWSQQGPPADHPMVSQESGDEDEEVTEKACLNSKEWPSWSGQCPRCSATTLSSREVPTVLSARGKYQDGTSVYSKIKEFIVEVTSVFHKYFSGIQGSGSKQSLTTREPSRPVSIHGMPVLEKRPSKDAQTQAPSRASSVPVKQLPKDVISRASPLPQQVALVRAMPVLTSVAVTGSSPPAPTGVADDFSWVKPLAAHVSMQLRETVGSLRFFDMFALLQGQSAKITGKKEAAIDRTLANWLKAFEVMGSILLEDAPDKMEGFFNYSVTIRWAHDHLSEGAWRIYDQLFRKLKEAHPDMSWAVVHPQLWQKVSKPVPQGVKAFGKTCPLYDEDKCQLADRCQFAHLCSICGGKHPKMKCSRSIAPKPSPSGEAVMSPKPSPSGEAVMSPKPSSSGEAVVKPQPKVECSTGDLGGKDTKQQKQKLKSLEPRPGYVICRHYNSGFCKLGNGCSFKHACSGCGQRHSWANCGKVEPKKPNLKKKQPPDDEAVMKKKLCQPQQGGLVKGGLNFELMCPKCGGKHPSAQCTIAKPGSEGLKQESQKNPSGGPEHHEFCTWYNRGECKVRRKICRFKHACSGCGDDHPLVMCSKSNSTPEPPKKKKKKQKLRIRVCQQYNLEKCRFGNLCNLKHLCSNCHRAHPVWQCTTVFSL
ncbi:uncharacterized protein LOC144768703 [Lissotriton helveticus]